MLLSLFKFLSVRLRLSKPWKYKIPLLISFPYFIALNGNLSHDDFLNSIIASFFTVIGFLGIAYLNNDLSDIKQDELAQKDNSLKSLSKLEISFLYLLFGLLAFLPWKILPFDDTSVALITLELALFFAYSFQPFRLKEKGVLGIITDSLYAHVIPAILSAWTFYLLIDKVYSQFYLFLVFLAFWQFISGARNILSHQIKDSENDLKSGTKTWVLSLGLPAAKTLLRKYLIPIEALSFIAFLIVLQVKIIYLLPVVLIYWAYSVRVFKKRKEDKRESSEKHFTNLFLDDLYIKWLPLLVLSGMVFILTEVRYVLLIHLILFIEPINDGFKNIVNSLSNKFRHQKLIISLFNFNNYYRGLFIHLLILLVYTSLFLIAYFILEDIFQEEEFFFNLQLTLSQALVLSILGHLLLFFIFRKDETIRSLKEFFFEGSTAINLAIFRIITFFFIVNSFSYNVFGWFEKWALLPDSARVELPFIGWLVHRIPINPELYNALGIAGLILAICGFLGFQTKWTLKLYIPIALYLWGVPCFFGKLNHHHLMVWVPIILAFSPCSDTLSIDALIRRIRKKKSKLKSPIQYGLPFTFTWITLAIIYACSGFYKLWDTGLFWALSDNLSNQIQLEWVENYDVASNFRIDKHPFVLKILGLLIILFEITYPIFLLKPATRFVNFIGSWNLHLSAGYFLNIDFVFLRHMHFSLINWNWLLKRFKQSNTDEETNFKPKNIDWSSLKKIPLFYVGAILVGTNFIFGVFGISSWPFSAYPAYSGVVNDQVQLIEIKAYNQNERKVDVKAIGLSENFRWENIRPFEVQIAESVLKGDTAMLNQKLFAYWELWRTNVPQLKKVKRIEMDLITTGIAPEQRKKILARTHLGTVIISD